MGGRGTTQKIVAEYEITAINGERYIHPVGAVIGGVSKPLTEEERQEIVERARRSVEFGKFSLGLFDNVVLKNKAYLSCLRSLFGMRHPRAARADAADCQYL